MRAARPMRLGAGIAAPERDTLVGYQGEPGGPRDPATPGGYCLARCYCGTCPQYQPPRVQTGPYLGGARSPAAERSPVVSALEQQALAAAARVREERMHHLPPAPEEQRDWSEHATPDPDATGWPAVPPPAQPELHLQVSGWWPIYAEVVRGARTPREVGEGLGLPPRTVHAQLARLLAAGLVTTRGPEGRRTVHAVAQRRGEQPSATALWASRSRAGRPGPARADGR